MVTTWCCITPERALKTKFIMEAVAAGWPNARVCQSPPNYEDPFITWGQIWLAEKLIKTALVGGTPFYQIDNGFFGSAKGTVNGYYRFMYRRPDPVFMQDLGVRHARRIKPPFKPWRRTGGYVVLAIPGPDFGRPFGFDCLNWHQDAYERLKRHTDRPIKVRPRVADYPLDRDLAGAWALVTHSSNVAVDAVLAGIPVFVEPTASAAPVGNLDYAKLEDPVMPERQDWWDSLMCQQFTLDEMRKGFAYKCLSAVAKQVELEKSYWPRYVSSNVASTGGA